MQRFFGWNVLFESEDGRIAVVKRKDDRILLWYNVIYSRLKYNTLYTHSYWDYLLPIAAIQEHSNVLIMGLGGGTMPYQLKRLLDGNVTIDVVELNKEMVQASKVFLPEKLDANIIVDDATSFVKGIHGKYDAIIVDVFDRTEVPAPFQTTEFIDNAYAALKDDGVMGVNYITNELILTERLFKHKLRKKFKLYTIKEPRVFGNLIFVCSKKFEKDEIISRVSKNFKENKENSHIFNGYRSMR